MAQELLALPGGISYDGAVTDAELWAAVGAELRRIRTERGYASTIALATALKDPHIQKTLDRIERGSPGQVRSLHRYCEAVGTTLPGVLRVVLPAGTISGRAQQVAEAYDQKPTAQQLVDVALGIPTPSPSRGRSQAPQAADLRESGGDSRGRGRTARGRR